MSFNSAGSVGKVLFKSQFRLGNCSHFDSLKHGDLVFVSVFFFLNFEQLSLYLQFLIFRTAFAI